MSALKCGSAGGTLESQYNAFVNKKRPLLTGHINVLKARFMRESGIDGGQSAYDRFTTGLANSHSARAQSVNFCDMAGTLMTLAAGSTDEELSTLARSFSETPLGVGRSEEHTSELQSLMRISYAVFCLKKKKKIHDT